MENKEAPISFYVLASFGLLFLIFFFLGQPEQGANENNALTGALAVNDLKSTAGLVVIGTVAILVVGFSFIFFKKMSAKRKAQTLESPEIPKADKKVELPGSKLEDKHKEEKRDIPEGEVDELFGGDEEPHIKAPEPHEEVYRPIKDEQNIQKQMVNASELKGKIKSMLMGNRRKEDIFSSLRNEGYTMQQIEMATDDINLETLKDYIKRCMQRGLSKSQIFENLKAKNWKMELINKAFLSFTQ